jgi:hypothetical protein
MLPSTRQAQLVLSGAGDVRLWARAIDYTDMPDGEWVFFVAVEPDKSVMILSSEY